MAPCSNTPVSKHQVISHQWKQVWAQRKQQSCATQLSMFHYLLKSSSGRGTKYNCVLNVLIFNLRLKPASHLHQPAGSLKLSPGLGVGWTPHSPWPSTSASRGFILPALHHCDNTCCAATHSVFASRAWSWFEDFGADVLAWQPHAASYHAWFWLSVCLSVWPAGLTASVHNVMGFRNWTASWKLFKKIK